jgi:hypothetical protein
MKCVGLSRQDDEVRVGLALLPEVEQVDPRDVPHVKVGQDDVHVLVHI